MASDYPTECFPEWEPAPWPMEAKAADAQKLGFMERSAWSVVWQDIPWDSFPPYGIFGKEKNWFQSNEVVYFASFDAEYLILTRGTYHGFPDPPEWGLASRRKAQANTEWNHWGHFPMVPKKWTLP